MTLMIILLRVFFFMQFDGYFDLVDTSDKHQLVRTAFAIAAYFGANRIIEIQTVKYGGKIFMNC